MNKYWKKIILFTAIFGVLFITPFNNIALGAGAAVPDCSGDYCYYASGWEVIPKECLDPKGTDENCDVNSFVQLFINLANIMLKLVTPLAMIIIIYGGYQFITARGKQEQIQQGKKVLGSVFVGMVIIVFGGWVISYFIVQTLVGGFGKDQNTSLFNSPEYKMWTTEWWNPSSSEEVISGNGCCTVNNYGCKQMTEIECNNIRTRYGTTVNWVGNTSCTNNICEQIKVDIFETIPPADAPRYKCCKPDSTIFPIGALSHCFQPNENGCLDYPWTKLDENTCESTPDICLNCVETPGFY